MNGYTTTDIAMCEGCDWDYDCFYSKSPSYHCQKHADETGHKVHREMGRNIDYEKRDLIPKRKD